MARKGGRGDCNRNRAPFNCTKPFLVAPSSYSSNCRGSRGSSKKGPIHRFWPDLIHNIEMIQTVMPSRSCMIATDWHSNFTFFTFLFELHEFIVIETRSSFSKSFIPQHSNTITVHSAHHAASVSLALADILAEAHPPFIEILQKVMTKHFSDHRLKKTLPNKQLVAKSDALQKAHQLAGCKGHTQKGHRPIITTNCLKT